VAPEGAAICDNCDEILDASFLEGADEPPAEGERTDVGPAPTREQPGRTKDLRPPRLTQRGGWNVRANAPQPVEQRRPYLAAAPLPPPPSPLDEARRTAGDLGALFRSLSAPDRVAAAASAVMILLMTLPWRWTKREDDIIGLVAAWPVALLAAGVLALVYLRSRRADAMRSRQLRLGQAGAATLAALLAGGFLPYATESRSVRAMGLVVQMPQSKPALAAYVGLVCAVAMLLGSLPGAFADERH
jgi:hypothetical protein